MLHVVLLFCLFLLQLDGKLGMYVLCFLFNVFADLVQALLFIYYNKIDLHLLSIKKDTLKSNRDIIGFRSIITGNQIKDTFSQPVYMSSPTP